MNRTAISQLLKCTVTACQRSPSLKTQWAPIICKNNIHTSSSHYDLMEFFDAKKNWGESNIRVGRGWKLDELRIKSNTDLHKLWYILLKERNMLYTMEHECKDQVRLFPNPERIDKVQESMDNIETVIKERNAAYYELETGESGQRPVEEVVNLLGLKQEYKKKEYFLPKFMNSRWVRTYFENGYINKIAVKKFYRLYKEKEYNEARKARNRDHNHVQMLLKRFPDMDLDNLKEEYPNVDLDRAMRSKKARGHFIPKYNN